MSDLQHERITALAQDLKLGSLPDLYGPIAQSAAKRKDASVPSLTDDSQIAANQSVCGHEG